MPKPTKTELARRYDVSRNTLYLWLARDDCPDPWEDPPAFDAFVRQRKASMEGGRPKVDEMEDIANLKTSKLRADVVSKWQKIREYDAARLAECVEKTWQEVADILADLQSAFERAGVNVEARETINRIIADAVSRVSSKKDSAHNRLKERLDALEDRVVRAGEPRQ